jgi:Probable cobalt transporter subunit (CbtA)
LSKPQLVSRETQAGLGLFTGVTVYSAAVGGLFSLVFAFVYGRVGRFGPRATASLLALGGFVAIALVPDLKYPANPPSVGNPETIGLRTELFFVMLVISVAALVLAVALARRLSARYAAWIATLIAGSTFFIVIAIVQYALPEINEVPEQFSAVVLWR